MGSNPDGNATGVEVEVNERGRTHTAISNAVVRVTAEYTGRGPTRVRTVVDGDWIFVTLADTRTKGERHLAQSGRRDFVRQLRKAYQDAIAAVQSPES